jgi:gentisate 1,2-dioxygenase
LFIEYNLIHFIEFNEFYSVNMSTTTVLETSAAKSGGDFLQSLSPKHLAPLWTEMAKMVPPQPNPNATTAVWKYEEVRPLLIEAGEIVDAEEAERRVLMLVNPGMGTYPQLIEQMIRWLTSI